MCVQHSQMNTSLRCAGSFKLEDDALQEEPLSAPAPRICDTFFLGWSCLRSRLFSFPPEAFVISFTSDFIPRLVYQYMFSQTGTMHGFIDHTLSYFNVSNFKPGTTPQNLEQGSITVCRWGLTHTHTHMNACTHSQVMDICRNPLIIIVPTGIDQYILLS